MSDRSTAGPITDDDHALDVAAEDALAWIHEAGNPYFDWLFGDPVTARSALRRWMSRPDSEVSASRVRPVPHALASVGGYIALTVDELRAARRSDAMALIAEAPSARKRELLDKLREADGLFTDPADDELYLSKMGVRADARGQGHGRVILDAFVTEAAERGLPRLRLDVSAGNQAAIGLYRSAGFEVLRDQRRSRVGLDYFPMVRATVA